MIKVITYGTYDLLHYGHIRLLKRAKELGDYLIVGVTSDDFDKSRGKINVQQSLTERIDAVKQLDIADEVIVEEYEGQKIDDIRKYDVDIFTVGSDWEGKFDYLNEYCKVVYLGRTEGVSSSEIRAKNQKIRLGLVGDSIFLDKVCQESKYVNGIEVVAICSNNLSGLSENIRNLPIKTLNYREILESVDAVYLNSSPDQHFNQITEAIKAGIHIMCRSPITTTYVQTKKLIELSTNSNISLFDSIKTAYCTAYRRMVLLVKSGAIGNVVSIDATCTSLHPSIEPEGWTSIFAWGPIALLPIFDILGTEYLDKNIVAAFSNDNRDIFAKIDFRYKNAVASMKVARGAKAEGDLVISGTEGYIYIPSPWWKTDYFEIRYENFNNNKKHFYQLEGEGIRNELSSFSHSINGTKKYSSVDSKLSIAISKIMEDFLKENDFSRIEIIK
jgi:choline-phosphate cytidylyltransferase